MNLYGFLNNDGIDLYDHLGRYCVQTAFRWIQKPQIVRGELEWHTPGEFIKYLDKVTAIWEGTAEVDCCCGRFRRRSTKKGTMEGRSSLTVDTGSVIISGGSPLPGISISTHWQGAVLDIVVHILGEKIPGPGQVDETKDVQQAAQTAMEQLAEVGPPENMKWKGGWPCDN